MVSLVEIMLMIISLGYVSFKYPQAILNPVIVAKRNSNT